MVSLEEPLDIFTAMLTVTCISSGLLFHYTLWEFSWGRALFVFFSSWTAYWSCVETASKESYCLVLEKVGLHLMALVSHRQTVGTCFLVLSKSTITLDAPAAANLTGTSCWQRSGTSESIQVRRGMCRDKMHREGRWTRQHHIRFLTPDTLKNTSRRLILEANRFFFLLLESWGDEQNKVET